MGETTTSDAVPFLESSLGGSANGGRERGGGEERSSKVRRWMQRVVDVEEAKQQLLFSLPMTLCNVFYYCITLASVMFAGHLGELELAGATLANSWATVTGFAFMVGLSGALETLCGQAFGSKLYRTLGIHLQASCIISVSFSILISIIWYFTEPILLFIHQDPIIAQTAASYMKLLIPSIFAYGILQNILRFLQTQTVLLPLVVFSFIPLAIHIVIAYAFVHWTPLGFKGAPLAVSASMWLSVILLAMYVVWSNKCESSWDGLTSETFGYIVLNLKLALPSAAMVCLEYWAFEILVLIAGLMNDAEESTSLIAMCVNTEAIAYMVVYGLSAAASTRVSNELGAGNVNGAKNAMFVTLKLSVILTLIIVVALGFGHHLWSGLFSDSTTIIKAFASITPLLAMSITVDTFQGILSGVARGCGLQHLVVYVNLSMFYLIGVPIAVLLAFTFNLEAKGLWIGLICGLSCQSTTLLVVILRAKWGRLEFPANGHAETL